ncbi:MAG: tRNA lysidine(34) synthetase TilS [Blautia massiliensis (ex Durand et al. 2017)]|nr:tRNA lysidine(34) synthetase TilS [Ruminococcus sp. AF46-10NS]
MNREGGRKKLNRVFIDEKIPASLRDKLPVVATDSEILWIPGGRMNEQYKITSTTGRVLELHYQGGVLS